MMKNNNLLGRRGVLSGVVLAMICILFAVGCTTDIASEAGRTDSAYIDIQVKSDRAIKQATKVSGVVDKELRIDQIVALVFNEDNEFVYLAENTAPKFDQETGSYNLSVAMRISKENEKYQLVLLANPSQKVNSLNRYIGLDKRAVLDKFKIDTSADVRGNNYILSDESVGIPMYGQTAFMEVNASTTIAPIALMRAVAKIDVFLSKEEMGKNFLQDMQEGSAKDYVLTEVYLYNSLKQGSIAPYFIEDKGFKWSDFEPSEPSLLEGYDEEKSFNQAILFDYNNKTNTITNSIYVAENQGGHKSHLEGVTALVLGLVKKDNTAPNEVQYYRLDLDNGDDIKAIIRNKHYQILLKDVESEGSKTPDEAIKASKTCIAEISVKDWKYSNFDYKLSGSDFFEISGRELFFTERGEKELTYKTNLDLDDILIGWDRDDISSANRNEISDDLHTIRLVTNASGKLVVSVTAKQDKAANLEAAVRPFYIFAGKMIIPIEIHQRIKDVTILRQNPDIYVVPYGYYVLNYDLDGKKSYLELRIPVNFDFTCKETGKKMQFKFELGDEIQVSTKDVRSAIKFKQDYTPIKYGNLKVLEFEENEKVKNIDYVVVRVPAVGKTQRSDNPEDVKREIYRLDVNIKLRKKHADYIVDESLPVTVDVSLVRPDYEYVPKILVVGESYTIIPAFISSIFIKGLYDTEFMRMLLSEHNFGMKNNSKIRVESYSYSEIDSQGNYGRVRTRNIKRVDCLNDLGMPTALEDFDIVLYLDSSIPNEIANPLNIYGKMLMKLVKEKKLALIQTPSRSDALPGNSFKYTDPMLSLLLDNPKYEVFQSEKIKQMALPVHVHSKYEKELIRKHYTLSNYNKVPLFFASREGKAWVRDLNFFANFKDVNYLLTGNSKGLEVIASHNLSKIEDESEDTSEESKALIVRSTEYPYMWIGNGLFFSDKNLATGSNASPYFVNSNYYNGLPTGKGRTYNAYFAMNVLEWAMAQVQHKLK